MDLKFVARVAGAPESFLVCGPKDGSPVCSQGGRSSGVLSNCVDPKMDLQFVARVVGAPVLSSCVDPKMDLQFVARVTGAPESFLVVWTQRWISSL